ncbi:hypothetical protein SISSUDRAFT_562959 [Sistotremastrum suecicum HHB10207 ss-3]|uniref:Uncharacterized protein n=1 Tax=Sistotremastrum suecicum HHB10207 ss-3 TaxID=1314776 RepID=A0A166ETB9_9AGAM|nr:hypothetical protein SISSUDRAFT_562959 [Sistotremastrum suecicum HHB10207 ss-3]
MALSDPMPSYICPSAHSLWRVPELVAEVMDHLSQRDLSVCARVSKGVSHYALGSLYKTGVSIQHVLNILAPVHLVSSPAPNVKYKEMNFLRSPGSNDWDNFYQYARRVRSLSCIDLDASDQLFLDISSVLPAGTLLFPHLRSLEWKINSPRLRAHVDFFMGDALSDVAISGPLDFLSTTLGLLSQRSPAIRRLSLHVSALEDSPTPAAVMQDIMTSIKAFKGLEHLQMSPQLAPAAAVPFLSRLPRLTTLYLRPFQLTTAFLFGDTFRYTVPRLKALDSDFQCLKDLICEVGLLLAGVSPSLSALSLQKLHVAINPTNTEADLAQLGCLLRDNCKTLTYIMIIFDTPTLLPAESSPITRSVLKLFLGIRLLRHLNIDDVRPARLSCAELEELAPTGP